jgi:thiamine-monophosphate kinase
MFAATGGDDYALLAALPRELDPLSLSLPAGLIIGPIGTLTEDAAPLRLVHAGEPVALPESLGHEHRSFAPPVDHRR